MIQTYKTPIPNILPEMPRCKDRIPKPYLKAMHDCLEGRQTWPLTLAGNPGSGKTCAAICLLDHTRGYRGFVWFSRLCQIFIDAQQTNRPIETTWANINRYELLVIDDLGTRKASDFQLQLIVDLLDRREAGSLATIFTTNLLIDGLAECFDDRVTSRLLRGPYVWFDGKDQRKKPGVLGDEQKKYLADRERNREKEEWDAHCVLVRQQIVLLNEYIKAMEPEDLDFCAEAALQYATDDDQRSRWRAIDVRAANAENKGERLFLLHVRKAHGERCKATGILN